MVDIEKCRRCAARSDRKEKEEKRAKQRIAKNTTAAQPITGEAWESNWRAYWKAREERMAEIGDGEQNLLHTIGAGGRWTFDTARNWRDGGNSRAGGQQDFPQLGGL